MKTHKKNIAGKFIQAAAAILLVIISIQMSPFPARGGTEMGVGIVPGIVRVDEPLESGKIYRLPNIIVLNPGKVDGYFIAEISETNAAKYKSGDYLRINPQEPFLLKPSGEQSIQLTLELPPDTEPGTYLAYISAHRVTGVQGAFFDLDATTKVYYTVAAPPALAAAIKAFPWSTLMLILVSIFGAGIVMYLLLACRKKAR
ncbi:MAG: hypothetical protein WC370_04825 [Dehalococcoidales bacterium]|jgi:hypothetical protein